MAKKRKMKVVKKKTVVKKSSGASMLTSTKKKKRGQKRSAESERKIAKQVVRKKGRTRRGRPPGSKNIKANKGKYIWLERMSPARRAEYLKTHPNASAAVVKLAKKLGAKKGKIKRIRVRGRKKPN